MGVASTRIQINTFILHDKRDIIIEANAFYNKVHGLPRKVQPTTNANHDNLLLLVVVDLRLYWMQKMVRATIIVMKNSGPMLLHFLIMMSRITMIIIEIYMKSWLGRIHAILKKIDVPFHSPLCFDGKRISSRFSTCKVLRFRRKISVYSQR